METNSIPKKKPLLGGLWRSPDFMKLWVGQTISEIGSNITRDGLPLLAVITLGASAAEMGVLSAIASAPVLVISLAAGVWVDRLPRRPLLILTDIGRALLLATIPLAALAGLLNMGQLYLITALTGVLTVLFNIAYPAYLPTLIEREHLLEGNSKLAISSSAAEIAGTGLAGVLVQLITAPIAILFDALSFLVSAFSLVVIRKPEPPLPAVEYRQSMISEAQEGLRTVLQQPVLRALAATATMESFFGNFFGVLYALFAIRTLNISPAALGLTVAVGGASSLAGAMLARRVVERFGLGRTLISMHLSGWLVSLLIPLAGSFPALGLPLLIASQAGDALHTIYSINAISLRQSITHDRMLGRVNASIELLATGIGLLGALLGGVLGSVAGSQATLLIAALGGALSVVWLFFSPIREMQNVPEPGEK